MVQVDLLTHPPSKKTSTCYFDNTLLSLTQQVLIVKLSSHPPFHANATFYTVGVWVAVAKADSASCMATHCQLTSNDLTPMCPVCVARYGVVDDDLSESDVLLSVS